MSHESELGDREEFSFWNSSNSTISSYSNDYDQLGEEIYKRKDLKVGHSHYRSVSDPSRRKAIAEGRKELMEMMQSMPESSFELSFQDMVDEKQLQQHLQQHQDEKTCVDKTLIQSSSSNEAQPKKPKKIKKSKSDNRPSRPIMRVESMDSASFLLKMFFPTSLKKVKVDQDGSSKVSRRPSFHESAKHDVGKDWRIKSYNFQEGNNRSLAEDGISKNGRSSSSDKSRYFDRNVSFSQGCWPFLQYTKNKTKKVGG